MFWVFGPKACGNLSSLTRDQTCTLALEGEIIATGPPGKSQASLVFYDLY